MNIDNCSIPEGYEPIIDPDTGRAMLCDMRTGEIIDGVYIFAPGDTRITTPHELQRRAEKAEARKAAEERKEAKIFWRKEQTKLGYYCFVNSERAFDDISPETLVRLVYLSTFADYDTGLLKRTMRSYMHKQDLSEVLHVSKSTVYRFLAESRKYLTVNNDGTMRVEHPYFCKGNLSRREYVIYQKVYINALRHLYESCDAGDHKRLGYVFQMLPYVSVQYNMLCHNPDEADLDKVEPISVREFCEKIGYDYSAISRLRREYARIRFPVEGHEECFCSFLFDGDDIGSARIFVNPHILFSGDDYERVKKLGRFSKPKYLDISETADLQK